MREDFRKARKIKTSGIISSNIVAINGCCYGKEGNPDKGDYYKLCGQQFWEFISEDPEFYIKIIEPLGHRAKERNDEFWHEYGKVVNRLFVNLPSNTAQKMALFCGIGLYVSIPVVSNRTVM